MNKSLILVLTAFVPLAAADEVKLKDGTVYKNCTVEVETPESVSPGSRVRRYQGFRNREEGFD